MHRPAEDRGVLPSIIMGNDKNVNEGCASFFLAEQCTRQLQDNYEAIGTIGDECTLQVSNTTINKDIKTMLGWRQPPK